MNLLFDFTVDKATNTIHITREFAAEFDLVWDAFTKAEMLDQWSAPKPWKAPFCDENGNPLNTGFTSSLTKNSFKAGAETTTVQIVKKMANLSELEKLIAMGFKEGISAGLANLDEYLLTLVTNK